MKCIVFWIALIIAVRVCPQETIVDYAGMKRVVIMENGKNIRCHEVRINYDNTTDIIIYNAWGSKTRKIKSSEIQNLLHVRDLQ